jgi:hypothetical protein
MNTNWTIHQLERRTDDGFVINVHWRYSMTDEDVHGKIYYADTYDVISYVQDYNNEFIPYEELTKEIVIGWIIEYLGESKLVDIENSLISQIEMQKNPPILRGLPWEVIQILDEPIIDELIIDEPIIDDV